MATQPSNVVSQIKKATHRRFSADEKIRIVLEGLRGQIPISQLCRKEGISAAAYHKWAKGFPEAGKTPACSSHLVISRDTNSGPLSLRR